MQLKIALGLRNFVKTFHTYIKRYHQFVPERLYGEWGDEVEKYVGAESKLYIIAKTKRHDWIPTSFAIGDDYKIAGKLRVGNRKKKVTLDIAEYWYSNEKFRSRFTSKEEMASEIMKLSFHGKPARGSSKKHYRSQSRVLVEKSDRKALVIECEMLRNLTQGDTVELALSIYQSMNFFDLAIEPLEIVYIGSSVKGAFGRVHGHDRWGEIQAEKKDDEDIVVYFAEVEASAVAQTSVSGLPIIVTAHDGLELVDRVTISEMALINYFKPHYNWHHKYRDIQESERVKRAVAVMGYNRIVAELSLEHQLGKLETDAQPYQRVHVAQFDL
ncbi:hypothetical protein ACFYE8_27925 [Rhizobium leguminosarum]|uniref:hypothetical protein n=1 Tax=Rhizobium leguminosarum TaxID=384 RepID=UPI0036D96772